MTFTIKERFSGRVIATGQEEDHTVHELEGAWYFDSDCVDSERLIFTERTYNCPYKGICHWIDLQTPDEVIPNVAFVYKTPFPDYDHIAGRIAFYDRDTSGTLALEQ